MSSQGALHSNTGAFAIVTNRFQVDESTNGEEIEMNYIRLMDDRRSTLLTTLDDFEQGISITKCLFKGDETTDTLWSDSLCLGR